MINVQNELRYVVAIAILDKMLEAEKISPEEYGIASRLMQEKSKQYAVCELG